MPRKSSCWLHPQGNRREDSTESKRRLHQDAESLGGQRLHYQVCAIWASQREEHYKLIDSFCWFWLHFKERKQITQTDYWQKHLKESDIASWRGIAFEELCLQHITQIKYALNIGGVSSQESSLIIRGDEERDGMQIDLLIERADDVVNICEMKFYQASFTVTKSYAQVLSHRLQTLQENFPNQTFHLTYIGNTELARNEYTDLFVSNVTLDDLFT